MTARQHLDRGEPRAPDHCENQYDGIADESLGPGDRIRGWPEKARRDDWLGTLLFVDHAAGDD